MLPLLRRPSLKELLRHTREAAVCEMDLSHQRVMRDGGVLRIQPLQVSKEARRGGREAKKTTATHSFERRFPSFETVAACAPLDVNGTGHRGHCYCGDNARCAEDLCRPRAPRQ